MTPPGSKGTMQEASPTSDNRLTSFAILSSSSFRRRDAGNILITSIPLGKSFNKLGLLLLRLEWPFGRPLIPFGPLRTLVFKLGLIKPLRRNGATQASLGLIASPSCGTSCPPCISWISLMFDGAAISLPFSGFPLRSFISNIEGALHNAIFGFLWEQNTTHIMCIISLGILFYCLLFVILGPFGTRESIRRKVNHRGQIVLQYWQHATNLIRATVFIVCMSSTRMLM